MADILRRRALPAGRLTGLGARWDCHHWLLAALALTVFCGLAACARGPNPPLGTVGISLEDGRIAAAVRTALLNDRALGLRDIAVDAYHGVVSLSGDVRTMEEAQLAATLARGVRGVRDVKSSLKVAPTDSRPRR